MLEDSGDVDMRSNLRMGECGTRQTRSESMRDETSEMRVYSHMCFSLYTHGGVSVRGDDLCEHARPILETGSFSEKGHAAGVLPWHGLYR